MLRAFAQIMSRLFENSGFLSVFLKFRFFLIWFLLLSSSSDLQLQYLFGYITEVTMDNEQASREFIQLKNNPFPVLVFGRINSQPDLPFDLRITCAATVQEWEWTTRVELQTAAIQARSQMQILLDTFVFWVKAEEFFNSFPVDGLLFWNVGKFWALSENQRISWLGRDP